MKVKVLWLALALLMFGRCSSDDSYSKFSRFKASFTYYYVQTMAPLREALYSPGAFCTIKLTMDRKLQFTSLTLQQSDNVTDPAQYQRYVCLSGFIVGYANSLEMGNDELDRVCFDLACSNCYHDNSIKRDLSLREGGYAYCQRCKRTYNLNNQGIISAGEKGRPLERYHISLPDQNRMVLYN